MKFGSYKNMKLFLIIFILVFISACDGSAAENNQNVWAIPSPSPTPTITQEEKEESEKRERQSADEKQKAINDFIANNYKGWQYKGMSNDNGECEEYTNQICDLLLSKGQEEKVVGVMFKRFTTQDGTSRLIVYEARTIDLSKARIESIKENYLDNLTTDEVPEDLRDAIIESAND